MAHLMGCRKVETVEGVRGEASEALGNGTGDPSPMHEVNNGALCCVCTSASGEGEEQETASMQVGVAIELMSVSVEIEPEPACSLCECAQTGAMINTMQVSERTSTMVIDAIDVENFVEVGRSKETWSEKDVEENTASAPGTDCNDGSSDCKVVTWSETFDVDGKTSV